MRYPDRVNRRILLEAVETVRELQMYRKPKAGVVHRVKVLLRKAGIPLPRPRKRKTDGN
jgi:hypothetical protein